MTKKRRTGIPRTDGGKGNPVPREKHMPIVPKVNPPRGKRRR